MGFDLKLNSGSLHIRGRDGWCLRICAPIALSLMLIFADGCVTSSRGGKEVEEGEQYQLTLKSVKKVIPKITYAKVLDNGCRQYNLELIAQGEFVRHNGVQTVIRENRLCIGILPGANQWKGTIRKDTGKETAWFIGAGFGGLFMNTLLCGIPTISSLAIEPWRSYYGDDEQVNSMSDFGLLGCRKYLAKRSDSRRFSERSAEIVNSQFLFGYKVSVDGVEYHDAVLSNGYTGKTSFCTTKPVGSKLVIKLLSVPKIREDSDDKLADLVGVEMEAVLP